MKQYVMETSPLGPSAKVKAALRKAIKQINTPSFDERERLVRLYHSRYGTDGTNLLFANSLKELLALICRRFQPDQVLIAGPSSSIYEDAARRNGAHVRDLTGKEDRGFFPAKEDIVKEASGSDIVFIANPNRITGRVIPDGEMSLLVDDLSQKGCLIVVDESLAEFTDQEGLLVRATKDSQLIALRTTACYYGLPGLELSIAVYSPTRLEAMRQHLTSDPGILALSAARTAFRDKSYRRLSERFMVEEKLMLQRAIRTTPGVDWIESDTNVFLLKAEGAAASIAEKMKRAGLAVEHCTGMQLPENMYLRVSVMKHDHNRKFIRMLKEFCARKS